jgi:hypothetical protein
MHTRSVMAVAWEQPSALGTPSKFPNKAGEMRMWFSFLLIVRFMGFVWLGYVHDTYGRKARPRLTMELFLAIKPSTVRILLNIRSGM